MERDQSIMLSVIQRHVATAVEQMVTSAYDWAVAKHHTGNMEDITPIRMAVLCHLYMRMKHFTTEQTLSQIILSLAYRSSDEVRSWLHKNFTFSEEEIENILDPFDGEELDLFFTAEDLNKKYEVLLKAASSQNRDVINWLIKRGVDVNTRNSDGLTPLHIAAEGVDDKMVLFLLEHGADCYALDGMNEVPFEKALSSISYAGYSIADLLLPKMFLNKILPSGNTRLHQAAFEGDSILLQYLLLRGAVFKRNIYGFTALHLAAMRGFPDAVKVLLEHYADRNAEWPESYNKQAITSLKVYLDTLPENKETGNKNKFDFYANRLYYESEEVLTPLRIATIFNHKVVVNILRAVGAD